MQCHTQSLYDLTYTQWLVFACLTPRQILLNYLPFDQKSWPGYLEKQRSMYRDWVKELVVDPHAKRVRPAHTAADCKKCSI